MPDPSGTFDACRIIDRDKCLVEDLGPDGTPRKKVAIVGFSTTTKHLAPYADLTWSVWGMNQLYRMVPRLTRWFEIHPHPPDPHSWLADQAPDTDYFGWMKACPVPLYMQSQHPEIPTSLTYPLAAMIERFRLGDVREDLRERGYFHSSVDYMLALAIAEGFEEIGVYGIDMAHDCVTPSTRVLTADLRWVPAAKLSVGDPLLAFDEHPGTAGSPTPFRRWRMATVTATQSLTRPCYRITLTDGTEFIASKGHLWLTHAENENRWKKTEELVTPYHRRGRPTRLVRLTDVWDEDRSWDAGYVAAAFDGEGHLSQRARCYGGSNTSLGFSQRVNAMSGQVLASLAAAGFHFRDRRHAESKGDDPCWKYSLKGDRAEMLRFLGQIRPRRLLSRFDPDTLGIMRSRANVAVDRLDFLGDCPVIGLGTTTKTFVAEGFASHNSEYQRQKPSASFWLGIAHALGIKVTIPPVSALLNNMGYRYGYDPEPDFEVLNLLGSRMRALHDRRLQLTQEVNAIDGALQENAHWTEYHKVSQRGGTMVPATSTHG